MEKSDALAVSSSRVVATIPNAANLRTLADDLLKSNLFPAAKSLPGVISIIQYGSELGMGPVAALQTMSIVNGRIAMESKAMLGLFKRMGGKVKIIEKTPARAEVKFWYAGDEEQAHTETFTMKDADRIGLSSKQVWKQYPEEMLYWRCVAKGLRAYDPNVIMGLYSREEMQDMTPDVENAPRKAEQANPAPDTVDGEIVEPGVSGEGILPSCDESDPLNDAAPVPDKPDYPTVILTKTDGKRTKPLTKYECLPLFEKIKKALGSEMYYSILNVNRYEHANEVPIGKIKSIWDDMVNAYKTQQEQK
jgi:hypothetical protein